MTARARRGCARPEDLAPAFAALLPKPLILEGFVDFACEISVVCARGADGGYAAFDTVENRHRDHILDLTLAPARIAAGDRRGGAGDRARRSRRRSIWWACWRWRCSSAADGRVLVNEIAPRPHNSGHWTIDACPASQFELHIRAIAGLPLPPAMRHSDAVMKNLVGPEEAGAVAGDRRDARPDPASLRQDARRGRGARWAM